MVLRVNATTNDDVYGGRTRKSRMRARMCAQVFRAVLIDQK